MTYDAVLTQIPYSDPIEQAIKFAENAEPRVPVVVLADVSASMTGAPIEALMTGLKVFREEVMANPLAAKRVEVSLVSFSTTVVATPFTSIDEFVPPMLMAEGATSMGAAINKAIAMLRQRKNEYNENGIDYYRPWVLLLTDGEPTDEWQAAAKRVVAGVKDKEFVFIAVGIADANFTVLRSIAGEKAVHLDGLKFSEMFVWLSQSLSSISASAVSDQVTVAAPTLWVVN